MAATLPRPSRPSNGPPTMALPALPIAKTRKSTGNIPTPASRSPPTSPAPTSALPQPRSSSALGTPARTLRKTVSINSFPQPPRSEGRVSSLPPSPLGADSPRNSVRKSRASLAPSYSHLSNGTPSLLNNSGEGKSISSASAEEALGSGGDGGARVLLERYRMEIADLRLQLDTQAKAKKQQNAEEEKTRDVEEEKVRELEAEHRHEEQMLEMHLARTALKERIDHLNRLILSSKSTGVNSGTFSSLGVRSSMLSSRSSMATPSSGRPLVERTSSMTSATSTIGRRSSGGAKRLSGGETAPEDEDSTGEYGDGTASLTAQNRALQADLADKTRYIQTLEKRLMQARRASSSRTSIGFSAPNKGIMVGEDHSVSTLLKDKDTEIADLRARLDDKDRMLAALRSAARSRDTAEGTSDNRTSSIFDSIGPPPTSPPAAAAGLFPDGRNRRKSVDEMSKMLDEMIHERVENGQIVRGNRGSVRVVNERRLEPLPEPATGLEPLRQSPTVEDAPKVLVEA
ncbi:hypothetical protein BN1723_009923 [Verticillium longisporum]|uniref:Uncharacterized protein n=1 Tax=Verticillium longisporum TaxID=100787 RepID=A0A0G4KTF1_VERLO|nr:hypothetical protein BN1723_009923 [Verticillium longisporum]